MKLITSDLQFTDDPRDSYRFGVRDTISRMLQQFDVEWLYILGDLTEAKDQHPASLVNTITDTIREWTRHTQVLILQGNHDYLDIAHPFFEFLKNFGGVKWISKPTKLRDGTWMLPHTRHYKQDWKDLDLYGQVYAHNIFEGTRAGNGHVLDGIPLTVFDQPYTSVISGDVHEPQSFGCVTYVGSPYTCDFGDDYNPRVLLVDNKGKMKSIPVPGPQKRLIECVAGQGLLTGWIANAGDILKIRVVIKNKHVERWNEIKGDIRLWGVKHGYLIHSIEPIMENVVRTKDLPYFSRKTDAEYIREYASRRDLDEVLTKTGLAYLD